MRQINFGLIFSFGLITVFFTLANTNPTTVHVLPGVEYTLPLAGLLLLAAGLGAVSAWFFAAWTGMLNNVEQFSKANEYEAQQCGSRNWRPTSAVTAPPLKPSWASSPQPPSARPVPRATTTTRRRSPMPAARPEAALATPVEDRYLAGKG